MKPKKGGAKQEKTTLNCTLANAELKMTLPGP